MKRLLANKCNAFTKVELVVSCAVVLFVIFFLLTPAGLNNRGKAPRIKCVNNLKNVGLGFRIFATDHRDLFPFQMPNGTAYLTNAGDAYKHFLALSNEIVDPKILRCPADEERKPANSWTNFSNDNLSYFVNLSASETFPQCILAGDRNLEAGGVPLGPGRVVLTATNLSWSKAIHNGNGNAVMGDGSVQQLSPSRIREILRQGMATNILLVP